MAEKKPSMARNRKTKPGDQRGARKGQTTMDGKSVGGKGGSIGQEPYLPTERDRAFVRDNVFYAGQEICARRLGISVRTLERHFPEEIAAAEEDPQMELGKTAMQKAREGDGPMLRFVLSTRFPDRWSPKYRLQHGGKVGVESHISPEQLKRALEGKSKDEIDAIIAGLDALLAAGGFDEPGGDPAGSPDSDRVEG